MTAAAMRWRATGDGAAGWRSALPALGALLCAILVLFTRDVGELTRLWWTSSSYGYCLFILPIVLWLIWQRLDQLARLTPRGWWPGLLAVAAGAGGWLLGDAAGVAIARHFALVLMVQGAVAAVLGPAVVRGIAFPLCYLLFLVPAGEELAPPLQTVTARMCMALLSLSGIPARLDGVFIATPAGWFEVAEACSGAKFVIAMIALGALAAHLCFRSGTRRALFMAAALAVPVLANGVRAFGTILVAQLTGARAAADFDHIVYGWIMFAVVIAVLLGVSSRFFDRPAGEPAIDAAAIELVPPARRGNPHAVAVAATLIVAVPVAWSGAHAGAARLSPVPIEAPRPAGWKPVPAVGGVPWRPSFPGADRFLLQRYRDAAGREIDLAIAAYGDQREGREVVGFGIGAVGADNPWAWTANGAPVTNGQAVRIVGSAGISREVVSFYRIGDTLTGSPARVKLATLRARLMGGPQRAVAVLVSAQATPGGGARTAVDAFLAALGPLDTIADEAAR